MAIKKVLKYFLFFMIASQVIGRSNNKDNLLKKINLIPIPYKMEVYETSFIIDENTFILIDGTDTELKNIAAYFANQLNLASGLSIPILSSGEYKNAIIFSDKNINESLGFEGYELQTSESFVKATGTPHGLFYAVQTLFQLLPEEIYSNSMKSNISWSIPSLKISDKPRFRWRGMHLDVGRHLFPVSFIKKYIDYLALHKLNIFHWHLTEDQGWRIEIKRYPRLTDIGSKRKGTTLARLNKPDVLDGVPYGGYYTQEDIKEIVEYAQEKYITVIPEIELPGHSRAALASYPELSCTGGPFEVRTNWGIDKDIYCAGNDHVFEFLENVLSEVISLFPSEYIHIGGDEAPKDRWHSCVKCQRRIKNEGLKDEYELQSYFIKRVEKFLNSNGRKIMGWDEILEGGLAPNAAVMSWRGISGGIEAARQKHNVVMSPSSHCYFNNYQLTPENEPRAIGGLLPLEKVYSYEPVPAELNIDETKYVIGVQANVWTEYITTPEKVEYMVLPRMCAIAEIAWSEKEKREISNFLYRMDSHYKRLDIIGINYCWPKLDSYNSTNVFMDRQKIELKSLRSDTEIRYTLDGSEPNKKSKLFLESFSVSESTKLKVIEIAENGNSSPIYSFDFIKQTPYEPINIVSSNPGIEI